MMRVLRADRRGPRVVSAEEQTARERAQAILVRANEEAQALRARAQAEGEAAAMAKVAAELANLAETRDAQLQALEPQAVELALMAAQHVIAAELALRPEAIADIVRPLVDRARRSRQLTLRVHPDDRAALQETLPALCAHAAAQGAVSIEVDATLARGGCVVTSDAGIIDARVDVRLEALREALLLT
jgi:type III secretion protein L